MAPFLEIRRLSEFDVITLAVRKSTENHWIGDLQFNVAVLVIPFPHGPRVVGNLIVPKTDEPKCFQGTLGVIRSRNEHKSRANFRLL